jgi:hypothetical protein
VARLEGNSWVVQMATANTSFAGPDAADDPQWRVYVGKGTCSPTPGPTTVFDPAGADPLPCVAPAILSKSDTSPSGGGTVSFRWDAVAGATLYRVARRQGNSWVVQGTPTGTSWTGADAADDPQWRVYVGKGTCSPLPGATTVFDP